MSTNRKIIFVNDYFYHVYNRGIEKRAVFTNRREFQRFIDTFTYYRFQTAKMRFSKYLVLPVEEKKKFLMEVSKLNPLVDIVAFSLMSNHFHFILKQKIEDGISKFISKTVNSYSKYFNTKHKREGPLFQGIFKAVWVETDEQLMHLSRYIHLNPYVSSLVKLGNLYSYKWSSLRDYLETNPFSFIQKESILGLFKNRESYKKFVIDYASYAKELGKIKDLIIER